MAVLKLRDDDRAFRDGVARDLRSYWVGAYLGLYLTAEERERFRRLDAEDLAVLIHNVKRMRRRGFDPALAREIRRAVLTPGEADGPVTPRAAPGALFGPPVAPAAPLAPKPEPTPPPGRGPVVVAARTTPGSGSFPS